MHRLLTSLAFALTLTAAQAEKADRLKPMIFTAEKQGRLDGVNQRTELLGGVIITQGSLQLRAEKVDLRETREGHHQAFASGIPGQPVSFHQALDRPNEAVDGVAEQLEYDTRTETVRFIGNARLRSTKGAAVTNEVTGAVIVFNSRTEDFTVEGGQSSSNPGGRVRMIRMPPGQPDDATSSPASPASPATPAAPLPLKPSTVLQPGKPS